MTESKEPQWLQQLKADPSFEEVGMTRPSLTYHFMLARHQLISTRRKSTMGQPG